MDFPGPAPTPAGYKTGTVEYTSEYSATVIRRMAQHRLSKQQLPDEESLRAVRKLRKCSQFLVAEELGTTQSEISARFPGLHVRIKLGRHEHR